MSTNHNSEIYEVIHGEINFQIIDQYLSIKDAAEVARLAAVMTPKIKYPSPRKLIDAALSLQEEAGNGLVRQRHKVLSKMNLKTALELASQLGVLDKLHITEKDPVLNDPVKAPVIGLLKKIFTEDTKLCIEDDKQRIDKALAEADARTELPRPANSSNLEEAIRYVLNEPKCAWEVLERSFIDFLGVYRTESDTQRDKDEFDYAKLVYEREEKMIISLKKSASDSPQALSYLIQREEELERSRINIQEREINMNYRNSFSPTLKTPNEIKSVAMEIYQTYWKSTKSVIDTRVLFFLSTDFYVFWKIHSEAYLNQHEEEEKKKRQTSIIKTVASVKGTEMKSYNEWVGRSKSFTKFRKETGSNPKSTDVASVVESFVETESGLQCKKAKKKLSDFLKTLTNKGNLQKSALDLLPIITNIGIGAMTERTIIECQIIINGDLRDSRKKL